MSADGPERALELARERAAAARSAGEYAEAERFSQLDAVPGDNLVRLRQWAFVEVDPAKTYSTRRFGALIALLKRGLLRLLDQYHNEALAQQTRFNLDLVDEVARLHSRVARLEQLAAESDDRR